MTLLHTILPSGEVTSWEYEGPLEYRAPPFQAIRRLIDPRDIARFQSEAMSGDYDKVLTTCCKWADVS